MATNQENKPKCFGYTGAYAFFSCIVKRYRYIHNEYTKCFLDAVSATSKNRETSFCKDTKFWRAQLGSAKAEGISYHGVTSFQDIPYRPERMKPLANSAKEGRANPKGIPCLYLATSDQTAIQEVRPLLGSKISMAQFRIIKDLKIVDCSKNIHKLDGTGYDSLGIDLKQEETLSDHEKEECVWSWIDRAFSEPIDPSDDKADYVPTQILAELFKTAGYDGIFYNSTYAQGKNIALFDLKSAEQSDCKLYRIDNIPPFGFKEII